MFLYFLVVQDIWGRGVLDFSFLGGGEGGRAWVIWIYLEQCLDRERGRSHSK